ncbi:methylenetetrahydrofolate reductase [Candidatus Parcubacteria bacterium]|nr:methylenetetrahydrofolate reductase [Candidatus Parcubacteria bacterium]
MIMESIKKLKFEKNLRSGKFAVTCEIGPPKGAEVEEIKEAAGYLKDVADGINVTDLQSSVMRLGSLTTCHLLKEWGLDPIFQVTCRDRNRLALQSDLLSAYVMGIRNVLALTGDYTTIGDHPHAEPVFDIDSVQLLWVIKKEGFWVSSFPARSFPSSRFFIAHSSWTESISNTGSA